MALQTACMTCLLKGFFKLKKPFEPFLGQLVCTTSYDLSSNNDKIFYFYLELYLPEPHIILLWAF